MFKSLFSVALLAGATAQAAELTALDPQAYARVHGWLASSVPGGAAGPGQFKPMYGFFGKGTVSHRCCGGGSV